MTVAETLAAVRDGAASAADELDAELSRPKPRVTLVRELRRLVAELGRHRQAVEQTLSELTVTSEHRAVVETCRALADMLDARDVFDDKLFREYRLALAALREVTSDDGTDQFAAWVGELRAALRDTSNG